MSSPASSRCWTRSWGCPSVRPPALCRGGHPPSRCPSSRHLLLGAEAGQLRDPPGFGVELCAVADLINRVWIKPPLCARPHMPIDSLAVSGLRPAREPKPLAVVGSLASPAVGATGSAGSSTWISRAHLGGRAPGGDTFQPCLQHGLCLFGTRWGTSRREGLSKLFPCALIPWGPCNSGSCESHAFAELGGRAPAGHFPHPGRGGWGPRGTMSVSPQWERGLPGRTGSVPTQRASPGARTSVAFPAFPLPSVF